MENYISVIIPCFNENITKIQRTVDNLTSNSLVSEVIVVDDNSTIPIQIKNAKVIRNSSCLGGATSKIIGMSNAKSQIILTTDVNARFKTKDWAKYVIESVLSNPKSVICPSCTPIGQRFLAGKIYGGYLDCVTYRGGKPVILESRWRVEPVLNNIIECIKGATYAFDSSFIKSIGGFSGIKGWGDFESVAISLKTRLAGGTCLVLPNVDLECEFLTSLAESSALYNKMRLAFVTMPPEISNIIPALLSGCEGIKESIDEFMSDFKQMVEDRDKFREICKVDPREAFMVAGISLDINLGKSR